MKGTAELDLSPAIDSTASALSVTKYSLSAGVRSIALKGDAYSPLKTGGVVPRLGEGEAIQISFRKITNIYIFLKNILHYNNYETTTE